jgi:protein N-lysine methyltransferase METTL21A
MVGRPKEGEMAGGRTYGVRFNSMPGSSFTRTSTVTRMTEVGEWEHLSTELSSVDGELLRYPERAFQFHNSGFVLINQSTNSVGTIIWDAEVLLAHYLDLISTSEISGKLLLELGAGTALASIVAAKRGAHVFIQELEEILPESQQRIDQNNVTAKLIGGKWGDELCSAILSQTQKRAFDLIVMADVLYHPEHFSDLVTTITKCSKIGTEVLIAFELRRRDLEAYLITLSELFDTRRVICYEVVRQGEEDEQVECVEEMPRREERMVTKFYLYHLTIREER